MTERKYEHTLDMDRLVDTAARYEQAVEEGQNRMWEGNDKTALHKAIDALELALAVSKRYGIQLRSDNPDNRRVFGSLRALSEHIQAHVCDHP